MCDTFAVRYEKEKKTMRKKVYERKMVRTMDGGGLGWREIRELTDHSVSRILKKLLFLIRSAGARRLEKRMGIAK